MNYEFKIQNDWSKTISILRIYAKCCLMLPGYSNRKFLNNFRSLQSKF